MSESELEEVTDNELEIDEGETISLVPNDDDEDGSDDDEIEDSDEELSDNEIPDNVKNIVGTNKENDFNNYHLSDEEDVLYGGSGEDEFNKFNKEIKEEYLLNFHPESKSHNYDEIKALTQIKRNDKNVIVDDIHKTMPILSKFEKTRILGRRIMQLNSGHQPFVKVDRNVIDYRLIAEMELEQKKIPFIVQRILPSGGAEYWNLRDLEIV